MKKSYKFLCLISSVVILFSCFAFSASAKMVEPFLYEWTGKELFDNVKDKRFYFNSGTEYLSQRATFISNWGGDSNSPIYGSTIPSEMYDNSGTKFNIFFSFIDLPEKVKINQGDLVFYDLSVYMSNNQAFPISQIMVSFRGQGTFEDGSTGVVTMDDYYTDTYHLQQDNYAEMTTEMSNSFEWSGTSFEADTLVIMYYGNFSTSDNYSTWRWAFVKPVQLYAGDASNFPVDLDEHVDGEEMLDYNASLESKIDSINADGKAQAENILKNFDNIIGNDTSIFKGVSAVTKILNVGLQVPLLEGIIQFALSLGMFSFVVGMGFLYNSARNKRISNERYANRKGGGE